MSTAAIDTPTEGTSSRRSGGSRPRPVRETSNRELVEVRQHTEAAVSDLIGATADAMRAFLPSAALRPTEAVEFTFDVAEQVLLGVRRVCVEMAQIVEAGLQGSVAASERRAA
jgi:hypothetical protein